MFARLTALVSSASALPFELGEPQGHGWGSWAHFRGTARADGAPVSVFRIAAANKLDPKLVAARNGVKRLKMVRWAAWPWGGGAALCTIGRAAGRGLCSGRAALRPPHPPLHHPPRPPQLRHPAILTFKDTVEMEEKGETVIYLMTEAVSPLATVLRDNDMRGPERWVWDTGRG